MCELTKKTDGFTVVGSCSLNGVQEASDINLSLGRSSNTLFVNHNTVSFTSSAPPKDSLVPDGIIRESPSICGLFRFGSYPKIALAIIKSCIGFDVVYSESVGWIKNLLMHRDSRITFTSESVIDASLQMGVPCKLVEAVVVPSVNNCYPSSGERNKSYVGIVRLLNLRSYQLQFSLPLLDYNTSGVEVYYR